MGEVVAALLLGASAAWLVRAVHARERRARVERERERRAVSRSFRPPPRDALDDVPKAPRSGSFDDEFEGDDAQTIVREPPSAAVAGELLTGGTTKRGGDS